jgi:hypothetical protein
VAASIAHFVSLEVGYLIETLSRIGFLATGWPWAVIAMLRMETVIYVAVEAFRTMKPWARANENPTGKPLRAVIAVWGAVVRRGIIVTIRTCRRNSDVDAYLSAVFDVLFSIAIALDSVGWKMAVLYSGALLAQYLMIATAARNYGVRFVLNVLAEESHSPQRPPTNRRQSIPVVSKTATGE